MRILADENVYGTGVFALRAAGHDVVWVREGPRGIKDPTVLELAQQTGRVVITFDKGFGRLVYQVNLPAESGVILFRLPGVSIPRVAEIVVATLESEETWSGYFSSVDEAGIRRRALP